MAAKNAEEPRKEEPMDDFTGFGKRVHSRNRRLLKPDGSFNIEVHGLPWFRPSDAYERLIKMSWLKFISIVVASYIVANVIFAAIYFLIGTEQLSSCEGVTKWDRFLEAFFFSTQSITTVGYGRVAPIGAAASGVAAIESMIGLLGFALATGLLYGRFSRPNVRLTHSRNILISPYKNGTALIFRIANMRQTQLVEVEVRVTMKRNIMESGKEALAFIPLPLENPRQNMFPLSWSVVHQIDEASPLWGKSVEQLIHEDVEFLIYFKGFDETFSNSVHTRLSYKADEVVAGARFIPDFEEIPGRPTLHDLRKIHDHEDAGVP